MRELNVGDYVQVYYNLHKHCYSVCDRKGKVIAYVDEITLRDVKFFVSEAGRQRVLREQRKNVHARVRGYVADRADCARKVRYNPYLFATFVLADTEEPVLEAPAAVLTKSGAYI
jgi:hypothetical protein